MPVTFRCPECGGLLSVPKKMQGRTINCPLNGCLIHVGDGGVAQRATAAGRQEPPPLSSASGVSVRAVPSPVTATNGNNNGNGNANSLVQAPAMPPVAASMHSTDAPLAAVTSDWFHRNTAQFITTDQAPAQIQLAVDGRLPELALHEGHERRSTIEEGGRNPLVLIGALCLSFVMSALLLFIDLGPQQDRTGRQAQARRELTRFYKEPRQELQPYQIYLRDAQQAHSRGDYEREKELYRRVLRLLRAEGRSRFTSVTRSLREDKELEALLAVLLADE